MVLGLRAFRMSLFRFESFVLLLQRSILLRQGLDLIPQIAIVLTSSATCAFSCSFSCRAFVSSQEINGRPNATAKSRLAMVFVRILSPDWAGIFRSNICAGFFITLFSNNGSLYSFVQTHRTSSVP
jgi:hypothetical protein